MLQNELYIINRKKELLLRQKKKIRIMSIVLVLMIFSALFIYYIDLNWIKEVKKKISLSKIVIIGERKYTNDEDILRPILTLGVLGNFITQDVNIIKRQIELLPWIKQVNIKKQWPDKLKIHLVEYVPITLWNNKYIIDIDGNFFKLPVNLFNSKDLPILHSPEDDKSEVLHYFLKMRQLLANNKFYLKEVVMTANHSWQLTLENGIKLNIGHIHNMNRLICFLELYPILMQQAKIFGKHISYIDLRYNSGAAVYWN